MNYILRKNKNNLISETDFQLSSLQVDSSLVCNRESSVGKNPNGSLNTQIEWLNSEAAAKYLCISVQTLRNLTSTSQVPYYKFGRLNRYRKDELDFCLLQNKRGQNGN